MNREILRSLSILSIFWIPEHRFRQWRCIDSGRALGGPGGRRGLRKYMDGSRRRIRRCVPVSESLIPENGRDLRLRMTK
jgi:hypothetical protein